MCVAKIAELCDFESSQKFQKYQISIYQKQAEKRNIKNYSKNHLIMVAIQIWLSLITKKIQAKI